MASIRRVAILIGAPALKGHDYLKGVNSDMAAVHEFLLSANGGAWESNEIYPLTNPKKAEILGLLAHLEKSTDYMLCAFGGHGHHLEQHDDTSLCINDIEEIKVNELFPTIPRQTLIVDACRKLTKYTLSLTRKTAAVLETRSTEASYMRSCRGLYDATIMEAERGRIIAYSCSTEESADDGLFTPALVIGGENFGVQNAPRSGQQASKVLTIADAFKVANVTTLDKNKLQNPVFVSGRRLGYFPFAVA